MRDGDGNGGQSGLLYVIVAAVLVAGVAGAMEPAERGESELTPPELPFFTILCPERADYGIEMPGVEKIAENDLWGFTMGGDTVLFSRRDGTWKHGDIETDARLVYVRRAAGKVTAFAVGEATTLSAAGKKLFTSKKKVTAAGPGPEIVIDDGGAWRESGPERGMPLD